MCQLLGMNCNVETDICFSFAGFSARGGHTDVHSDGWGIAFFESRGCRVFLDVVASHTSPVAELVRRYPIKSKHIVAHIRKATRGAVALANCHPFQRELWGRYWVFAHNGTLDGFTPPASAHYQAVGETDSEAAFCFILESLRTRFATGEPTRGEVYECLSQSAEELRKHGTFNFLLSDGDTLYAHRSTQLHYVIRQAPFAAAHLTDRDVTVDFSELTTPNDKVAVIATIPLTDNEQWVALPPDRVAVFRDGSLVDSGLPNEPSLKISRHEESVHG